MSVSLECCVLSGRGLCVELVTRPEESYRVVCLDYDREASTVRRPWPTVIRMNAVKGQYSACFHCSCTKYISIGASYLRIF